MRKEGLGLPGGVRELFPGKVINKWISRKVYKEILEVKDTFKPKYFPRIKSALAYFFKSANRN